MKYRAQREPRVDMMVAMVHFEMHAEGGAKHAAVCSMVDKKLSSSLCVEMNEWDAKKSKSHITAVNPPGLHRLAEMWL